jgi:glutathione S-transferase
VNSLAHDEQASYLLIGQQGLAMHLYTHLLSANAHKVKLLLGFLDLPHEETMIDIPNGEQRGEAFLAVTPLGQIPVLEDGPVRIRDAQAILIYLAGRYDPKRRWWPEDAADQGLVAQWLAFAALELQIGINVARLHFRLGVPCDLDAAQRQGEQTLALLEDRLSGREWLELDRPTIADLACVTFPARAGEAGHDLDRFPTVSAWIDRIRSRPGFLGMEGFA